VQDGERLRANSKIPVPGVPSRSKRVSRSVREESNVRWDTEPSSAFDEVRPTARPGEPDQPVIA
jgi:hypothetical protein